MDPGAVTFDGVFQVLSYTMCRSVEWEYLPELVQDQADGHVVFRPSSWRHQVELEEHWGYGRESSSDLHPQYVWFR